MSKLLTKTNINAARNVDVWVPDNPFSQASEVINKYDLKKSPIVKSYNIGDIHIPTKAETDLIVQKATAVMPDYIEDFKDEIKPIMIGEGYLSTIEKDEGDDIVLPSAFKDTLEQFMQFPLLFFNHNFWGQPLGLWYELTIDEYGLYGKNAIFDTQEGREIATLVKAGVIRAYSIGFLIEEWSRREDIDAFIIEKVRLLEGSYVSLPMNRTAQVTEIKSDLVRRAKAKNIILKHLTTESSSQGSSIKGVTKVEPLTKEEILEAIESKTNPFSKDLKETQIKVSDVKKEVEKLAVAHYSVKDALSDKIKQTAADVETKLDSMSEDFNGLITDIKKAVEDVKVDRTKFGGAIDSPFSIKALHQMDRAKIKSFHSPETTGRIEAMQKAADTLFLLDAFMEAGDQKFRKGRNYTKQDRNARIRELKYFNDVFVPATKALGVDTGADAGDEWIPDEMSSRWEELVRVQLKVANLFRSIPMPNNPYTLPILTSDTIGKLIPEKYDLVGAFEANEETPGTGKVTWNAVTCRGRIQLSYEFNEDSILPALALTEEAIVRSIARAIDQGIIDGDTAGTHQDADVTSALDFRKAYDGLRKLTPAATSKDFSSYTAGVNQILLAFRDARASMGKYGLNPGDLAAITSLRTYLKNLLSMDSVQTIDKYGLNAVIVSGELARIDNVPIVPSEFSRVDLAASGVYTVAGQVTGQMNIVNTLAYMIGYPEELQVGTEFDMLWRVWQVAGFRRVDFQPLFGTTEISVADIINIT